ncbi:hypothetical protein [Rhizobium sp. BG4]|uniref:hypothetical protein n=1 Tax=Rhizobium sp. BG4 TaxID=2613770 RepID=UPI00193D1DA4|nr:hypothetical protein [Rhizobium sp. BG4]
MNPDRFVAAARGAAFDFERAASIAAWLIANRDLSLSELDFASKMAKKRSAASISAKQLQWWNAIIRRHNVPSTALEKMGK